MPWHCKATGGYTTSTPVYNYPDSDGIDNCLMIWNVLQARGWTANAAAGLLTCAAFESGYNPWRWENNHIFSSTTIDNDNYPGSYGYGLLQWTPASYMNADYYDTWGQRPNKYINNPYSVNLAGYGPNFSDVPGNINDGAAQMAYLDDYGYVGQYFRNSSYPAYADIAPTFSQYKASTASAADLAECWVVNFERPQDPSGNRSLRNALAPYLYNLITSAPVQRFPVWLLFKFRENNFGRK